MDTINGIQTQQRAPYVQDVDWSDHTADIGDLVQAHFINENTIGAAVNAIASNSPPGDP